MMIENGLKQQPTTARKAPRTPVDLPVKIASDTRPSIRTERMTTIGAGGAFIETSAPEAVGTGLELSCLVGRTRIECDAVVVYTEMAKGPHGMGVEFTNLSSQDATALSEFISKNPGPANK